MKETIGSGKYKTKPQMEVELSGLVKKDEKLQRVKSVGVTQGSFNKRSIESNSMKSKSIDNLLSNYKHLLTGSRAWGLESYDSDYDYILPYDDYNLLLEEIGDLGYSYRKHPVYESIYVPTMDKEYNIIMVSSYEYLTWEFATKAMKGIIKECAIQDIESFKREKNKVYGTFEMLRSMYRFVGDNK